MQTNSEWNEEEKQALCRLACNTFSWNTNFKPKMMKELGIHNFPENSQVNINDIEHEKKKNFVWQTMQLCVSEGDYDARDRVSLKGLIKKLNIENKVSIEDLELELSKVLITAKNKEEEAKKQQEQIATSKASSASSGRWWKVGLGMAIGGGLMLLTGGLAAPLVLPAITAVITTTGAAVGLTAVSSVLAGALALGGVPLITGLFGIGGAGLLGYKVNNVVNGVSEFQFVSMQPKPLPPKAVRPKSKHDTATTTHTLHTSTTSTSPPEDAPPAADEVPKMSVAICVNGYLKKKGEDTPLWSNSLPEHYHKKKDAFMLQWETAEQLAFGQAIERFVWSQVSSKAAKLAIAQVSSVVAGALAAVTFPFAILAVSKVVDNPWTVLMDRADKSGKILASVLINHVHGHRPVTLIGYSAGARVIYKCLQELAKQRKAGIVENAILLGTPAPSDSSTWREIRKVVAGKLVNGYCTNDWVLAFLMRTTMLTINVAGLHPVEIPEHPDSITNVQLSDNYSGHEGYRKYLQTFVRNLLTDA